MSVPDSTQINNLTYKYLQGIPYTSTNKSTSGEAVGTAFPKIASTNIMSSTIPSSAPFPTSTNTYPSSGFTSTTFNNINIQNPDTSTVSNVSGGIKYIPTGTYSYLAYYVNIPLKAVDSDNRAYWDASTNLTSSATISATNRLAGAIPSNFDSAGNSYKIYVFKSDNSSNAIPSGGSNGWYFDSNAGFLVFNTAQSNATAPTITFWRYEGTYGIGAASQVSVTPASGTELEVCLTTATTGSLSVSASASLLFNASTNILTCPALSISSGTQSTTSTSGAIIITGTGGIGVGGNVNIAGNTYSTYFITTSDYRIKENPREISEEDTVDKLNPVSYINKLSNNLDYGFIAHEVQDIYPNLVTGKKDDVNMQSLNYIGIIALLVKEIQVLKKRVKKLEENQQL